MPAPGLLPSQLRELADCASQQPGPSSHPEDDPTIPGDFSGAPVRGRKRARKAASSKKLAAKISHTATRSYVSAPTSAPANILTTTLQSLANTLHNIDNRLENLENAANAASYSANISVPQVSLARTGTHTSTLPSETIAHSLASAVPVPAAGRPYMPQSANISARLRAKILQGKDINLISLILPSPECDNTIATGENFTAIFKTTDPRLIRDLSIGQFLIAFSIYRDIICSVYPGRRQELDAYLTLIGDLNLKYGRNIFYNYHKAFSSKAALYIAQFNTILNWSQIDSEILIMVAGGTQAISCNSCGKTGHTYPLCPSVPFQNQIPLPSSSQRNDVPDHQGFK